METGCIAPPEYLYDQAWDHERARLQALEALFDPTSRFFIERLGVGAGWRCLEVGFGAGGVAVWLADRVSPSGRVLATDLDPRLLPSDSRANLEIRRFDLLRDRLGSETGCGPFDLVHARAVLEHVPDRDLALGRLIEVVRPGGWLVIEDIDVAGSAMRAVAERYAWPPAARPVYERCIAALQVVLSEGGRDPGYGAMLPAALRDAGLHDVGAQLHAPIIAGGAPRDCMRLTFEYLSERLLATGLIDRHAFEQFLDLTRDCEFQYIPLFMVTAWGRRAVVG